MPYCPCHMHPLGTSKFCTCAAQALISQRTLPSSLLLVCCLQSGGLRTRVPQHMMYCRWSGAGVLGICLLCFATTSLSDPGVVTKDNEAFHHALYQYDEVTSTQKDCRTCALSRPARSKHCPICNRYCYHSLLAVSYPPKEQLYCCISVEHSDLLTCFIL